MHSNNGSTRTTLIGDFQAWLESMPESPSTQRPDLGLAELRNTTSSLTVLFANLPLIAAWAVALPLLVVIWRIRERTTGWVSYDREMSDWYQDGVYRFGELDPDSTYAARFIKEQLDELYELIHKR